jgi:hypothetical protein
MDTHLLDMCQEYVDLVQQIGSGQYSLEELRVLDSERQSTHLELCRITGKPHGDDMVQYAKGLLYEARLRGLR